MVLREKRLLLLRETCDVACDRAQIILSPSLKAAVLWRSRKRRFSEITYGKFESFEILNVRREKVRENQGRLKLRKYKYDSKENFISLVLRVLSNQTTQQGSTSASGFNRFDENIMSESLHVNKKFSALSTIVVDVRSWLVARFLEDLAEFRCCLLDSQ